MSGRNEIVDSLLEIQLTKPDNFLKIAETLTRIGISSKGQKRLTQTAHILQKKGRYYIVHFKELFRLDGRPADIEPTDKLRAIKIACLLEDWGLCKILSELPDDEDLSLGDMRIIKHSEKSEWELVSKYTVGKKS